MGRPTKLTPELHQSIVAEIADGQYGEVAAALNRISDSTYYGWKRRGEAEQARLDAGLTAQERRDQELPTAATERPYLEFLQAIKAAEATAEQTAVTVWRRAMADDWRAAKEYLERKHRDRWGKVNRNEISGPDGGPMVTQAVPTDAELDRMVRDLAAATVFPGIDPADDSDDSVSE